MLSVPALAKRLTHGFRVAKMRLDFPAHPEWEAPLPPEAVAILRQDFFFLGRGAQSYVFESEDGKYVIKLFHYSRSFSDAKVVLLFNACKMAYDHLREETGLLFIHLNPTPMHLPLLHCRDAVGRWYHFPLDEARFALQKKGKPFKDTLQKACRDPAEIKRRIDEFLHLLQTRAQKGILNTDPNLGRNFGFLDDQAIEFDFGNYRWVPDLNQKAEIDRYAQRLRRWLRQTAPEWVAYLDQRLAIL